MAVHVLSNNPKVYACLHKTLPVERFELGFLDFLKTVRDRIHAGAVLLSHPLSGSLKPGETPYKSVLLELGTGNDLDLRSLDLIEQALGVSQTQVASHRQEGPLSEQVLEDFQEVDYHLICSALESAGIGLEPSAINR